MAAAQNYSLSFVGRSGRSYSISGYTADTAGAVNTFQSGAGVAGAASLQYWRPPEDVTLVDFSMTTGTTQTHGYLTVDGAVKSGTVLSYVAHVSTNPQRPRLNIGFQAGSLVGATTI
jgi:hypothetical protein